MEGLGRASCHGPRGIAIGGPAWRVRGPEIAANLFAAFATGRLDYCNVLLADLSKLIIIAGLLTDPRRSIRAQQRSARSRDHVTPSLQQLR